MLYKYRRKVLVVGEKENYRLVFTLMLYKYRRKVLVVGGKENYRLVLTLMLYNVQFL
jgi:hypothetical protein